MPPSVRDGLDRSVLRSPPGAAPTVRRQGACPPAASPSIVDGRCGGLACEPMGSVAASPGAIAHASAVRALSVVRGLLLACFALACGFRHCSSLVGRDARVNHTGRAPVASKTLPVNMELVDLWDVSVGSNRATCEAAARGRVVPVRRMSSSPRAAPVCERVGAERRLTRPLKALRVSGGRGEPGSTRLIMKVYLIFTRPSRTRSVT